MSLKNRVIVVQVHLFLLAAAQHLELIFENCPEIIFYLQDCFQTKGLQKITNKSITPVLCPQRRSQAARSWAFAEQQHASSASCPLGGASDLDTDLFRFTSHLFFMILADSFGGPS